MATRPRASHSRPGLWGGLAEGSTILVDTALWIHLLEDHPHFAPRFLGLFEVAQLRVQYGLKLPGALQLAAALDAGAAALVTHDLDFSRVQGMPILTGA